MEMRAVAIGAVTQRLATLALGQGGTFAGFVTSGRNGRGWLFHITEVEAASS
jgi:primosomal replication protein N